MSNNSTRITTDLFPAGVFHPNLKDPMVDVRRGGGFGYAVDYQALVNDTPHVSNNLICRVLASPRGFDLLDGDIAKSWHGGFKALFETHAVTVEGLNKTLNPSWSSVPWGGSGEEFEVPTGMTRSKSDVQFTFNEKMGLPITHMVEQYHRLFIMDEDTKHPMIAMSGKPIVDGLADFYTWTMIFIEPDRYLQYVRRAWIVANMGIKTSPQNEGKRDKNSDQSTLSIDLQMSGISQVGYAVDAVARKILGEIRATQNDPRRDPAFMTDYSGAIKDQANAGFIERMKDAHNQQIGADV